MRAEGGENPLAVSEEALAWRRYNLRLVTEHPRLSDWAAAHLEFSSEQAFLKHAYGCLLEVRDRLARQGDGHRSSGIPGFHERCPLAMKTS